jgi:site-specific recombinase XerD
MGRMETTELTIVHIDKYAELLSLRNLAPKTYRNKLCIVRSFVRYLYRKELSSIRPESVEIPPDRPAETSYLTVEEKRKILLAAASDLRDYAMLQVLMSSGVRVTELCNLKTGDIFRRSVSVKNGKGRKHRVTFISPEAERAVVRYRRILKSQEGYVFPNPSGDHLSRVIVARKVKHYADKAGINKHVTVHTLRHTFATLYLDAGGRIEDLQQMLGHADLKTTLLYLHFTNERLHSAYDSVMH